MTDPKVAASVEEYQRELARGGRVEFVELVRVRAEKRIVVDPEPGRFFAKFKGSVEYGCRRVLPVREGQEALVQNEPGFVRHVNQPRTSLGASRRLRSG